jgi:hypothetical protein
MKRQIKTKLRTVRAFLLGVLEFRSCVTTNFSDWDLMCTYDEGRELAHKATRRRYEW